MTEETQEVETLEERKERRAQERYERQIALEMNIEDGEKAMKFNVLASSSCSPTDQLLYMIVKELKQLNENLKNK